MQIGVDACCWSNRRGFGRFTRELLKALIAIDSSNEYRLFLDQQSATIQDLPKPANIVIVPTHVSPTEAASASGHRSLGDLWAMTRAVLKHKLDLFFFPAIYSYFPVLNRAPIAITIHDMIPEDHPEAVFPDKRRLFFWKMKEFAALRQADLVVTVSNHSKQQILRTCRLKQSRVRVVSEAAGDAFEVLPENQRTETVLRTYGLHDHSRFLLYVGGISPHKNLKTLVDAFHRLIADPIFSDIKLVLVGDYETDSFFSDYPALKSKVDQLDLSDKVLFTGFVEDADLAVLYNAASLVVVPLLQEGFGLPAMEAMACGAAVASSSAGSLPEVLGEAGRFFDPYSPDDMLNVIRSVLSDSVLRESMKRAGLERAKQFRWETAAGQMLAIFNELITQKV